MCLTGFWWTLTGQSTTATGCGSRLRPSSFKCVSIYNPILDKFWPFRTFLLVDDVLLKIDCTPLVSQSGHRILYSFLVWLKQLTDSIGALQPTEKNGVMCIYSVKQCNFTPNSDFIAQYHRIYSPISFVKKHDPDGKYIKHFLPVLKGPSFKMPPAVWTAPISSSRLRIRIRAKESALRNADMPKAYIYEPWTAPTNIQKKAKCIIGKDYPSPGVQISFR